MLLIVIGVLLWAGSHFIKRLAPDLRARMGEGAGRGIVTVLTLAGLALMVIGYRGAEQVDLWYPPGFMVHVNNLLMLLAFYLYAASGMKTGITRVIRHTQLTAVKTWAVAHLLVNGDLAAVLLFGGLLAWAVGSVILINRAEPAWVKNPPSNLRKEVMAVVGAVVVMAVVMGIHNWFGVQPWG